MSLRPASPYVFPRFEGSHIPESGIIRFKFSSVLALLLCFSAAIGWAQTPSTLSGTVKDPTGAVVVQALVSLTESKTSMKKQTTTNENGVYSFAEFTSGWPTMRTPSQQPASNQASLKLRAATCD